MAEAQVIAFEFLIWFGWLGLFGIAQRRFCRKFPGMRSFCRVLFLATLVVVIVPALWVLLLRPFGGAHLLTLLNHCLGMGVFAQTFLRSVLMLKWVAWTSVHRSAGVPLIAANQEQLLVASLLMLTQAVGWRRQTAPPREP
jgi:hypothetical protein